MIRLITTFGEKVMWFNAWSSPPIEAIDDDRCKIGVFEVKGSAEMVVRQFKEYQKRFMPFSTTS